MNQVVVGVGSNIDATKNSELAKKILTENFDFQKESSWVTTKPIGFEDQPDFLNGVILLETDLSKENFNQCLKDIETAMGREKIENKFGPRVIDLDIVVWNGEVVDPDFYSRPFLKKAVEELLGRLD